MVYVPDVCDNLLNIKLALSDKLDGVVDSP